MKNFPADATNQAAAVCVEAQKKRPPKRPLSHLRTLVFVIAVGLGFVVRGLRFVDTGLLVLVVAGGGVLVLPVAGVVARFATLGRRRGRLRRRGCRLGRGRRRLRGGRRHLLVVLRLGLLLAVLTLLTIPRIGLGAGG